MTYDVYKRNADGTKTLLKPCGSWKEAKAMLNRLYDEEAKRRGGRYPQEQLFEIG